MDELSEQQRQDLVVNFYEDHRDEGKSFTCRHFQAMRMSKRTVYSILARYEERGDTIRKKGSGRPAAKMTQAAQKRLVKAAADKKAVSTRKLARKFGVDHSYISKVLRKNKCKYYKRSNVPQTTPQQEAKQKTRCRKLSRDFLPAKSSTAVVMDDESYFPFKHDQIPGNVGFYTMNKENTPPIIKYSPKTKFPKKMLVWIAISESGHSRPFFVPSRGSINGEVYRRECIEARLVPFLEKHHSDGDYIFWPDLASAHYAQQPRISFERKISILSQKSQTHPIPPSFIQLKIFGLG